MGCAVSDAMIRAPKVWRRGATVGDAHAALSDRHVHALLVVDRLRLLAVVETPDLVGAPAWAPAHRFGALTGRVVGPHADLDAHRRAMLASGRRRLAVVDPDGVLLGLLCLKASGTGFCTDSGVSARARERRLHDRPTTPPVPAAASWTPGSSTSTIIDTRS